MRGFLYIIISLLSSPIVAQLPNSIEYYYKDYFIFYNPQEHELNKPFILAVVPKTLKEPFYLSEGKFKVDTAERHRLFEISGDSNYLKQKFYRQPWYTYDTSGIYFFVQGINKSNTSEYEYRIEQNKGEIAAAWTMPSEFLNGTFVNGFGENDSEMAAIGPIKPYWDSYIKLEVRRKINKSIVCGFAIICLSKKPEVFATYNGDQINDFFRFLDFSSKNEARLDLYNGEKTANAVPKEKTFSADQNGIIFLLKDLVYKNVIQYRIVGDSYTGKWKQNEFDFNFIWIKTLTPGKYRLQLRYSMNQENISEYEFEILPAWYQTSTFKIITGTIIAAILGLILLLFRQRSQKNKLNRQLEQKEKKELELRSIRSQLNPHFVFNALNSIQGLVNANEKEKANQYLSDFSNMMRDTLSGNSKDYSPLETELAILDRYLKLEQLRFGFAYEIKVGNSINTTAIEIPTLLLQPLVENAVKHGVAQLLDKGKITIELNRSENDLRVLINDNGQGFSESIDNKEGFGIRLTRERIQLINQLYKSNPISLKFQKHSDAMLAEIIFSGTF